MSSYAEKLKDPRWQKKRLEIFERDEWKCILCDDTEATLHVHHTKYLPNHNPWDYDNGDLETLCDVCHEMTHDYEYDVAEIKGNISKVIKHFNPYELMTVFDISKIVNDSPNIRTTLKRIVTYLVERIDGMGRSIKANTEEKKDDG